MTCDEKRRKKMMARKLTFLIYLIIPSLMIVKQAHSLVIIKWLGHVKIIPASTDLFIIIIK